MSLNGKIDSSILERIRKLDAMRESTNFNEAQVAIKKLENLLRKYELEMSDIEFEEMRSEHDITDFDFITGEEEKRKANTFETQLAGKVGDYYNLYLTRTRGLNQATYYGRPMDIELALKVYRRLRHVFYQDLKKAQKENRRENSMLYPGKAVLSRGFNGSFKRGFLDGVTRMFRELKEQRKKQNEGTGRELILVTDKALAESYAHSTRHITRGQRYRWQAGNDDGYGAGFRSGKNAKFSDRLENK